MLATDGLFKTIQKEDLVKYIIQQRTQGVKLGEISQKVSNFAHENGCPDNTTILIVDLEHYHHLYQQNLINELSLNQIPFLKNYHSGDSQYSKGNSESCDMMAETEDSSTESSVDLNLCGDLKN